MPKIVVITGGTRGLGLALARHFVRAGETVAIMARPSAEFYTEVNRLQWLADRVDQVTSWRCDVSELDQVARAFGQVMRACGRVDVLVCCAGVYGPIGSLDTNDWDAWREAIEVNVLGTVLCCRAALSAMRSQGSGKIITLSGGGATAPMPNFSAYAASKAAVVRFTETLAHELCGTGIDCNSVAPGMLDTRLRQQVIRSGATNAGQPAYEAARADLDPDSMQPAIELIDWLASSRSDGITGRLISAVWDNWHDLDARKLSPDAYTLRRTLAS